MKCGQSPRQGTVFLVLTHSSRLSVNNYATALVLVVATRGSRMGPFSTFDPFSPKWPVFDLQNFSQGQEGKKRKENQHLLTAYNLATILLEAFVISLNPKCVPKYRYHYIILKMMKLKLGEIDPLPNSFKKQSLDQNPGVAFLSVTLLPPALYFFGLAGRNSSYQGLLPLDCAVRRSLPTSLCLVS